MIKRARTKDLFQYDGLTRLQEENNELNAEEMNNASLQLESYPRRFVLELTNACNLKCIMCGRDDEEFAQTYFDINSLDKVANILDKITEVTVFGWGEPMMHPKFRQILEYLNNYPLKKYFVTNGMLMDKFIDDFFNFNVDIIAISLDGASPEINDKIRLKGDFTKIIANIESIVARRNELRVTYPYMNFVTTLMKDNLEELPKMVKLAHDIGIEEVKAVYLTAFNQEMSERVLFNDADKVRRVFSDTIALGEKYNIKIKLPYIQGEDIAKNAYHKPCYVSWRDFFVGSDGYVRPCQSTSMKLFHFDKYKNFKEMWNSTEYQDFRKRVNDREEMPPECMACYQSSHANWNKKSSFIQTETGVDFAPKWERDEKK